MEGQPSERAERTNDGATLAAFWADKKRRQTKGKQIFERTAERTELKWTEVNDPLTHRQTHRDRDTHTHTHAHSSQERQQQQFQRTSVKGSSTTRRPSQIASCEVQQERRRRRPISLFAVALADSCDCTGASRRRSVAETCGLLSACARPARRNNLHRGELRESACADRYWPRLCNLCLPAFSHTPTSDLYQSSKFTWFARLCFPCQLW